MPPSYGTHTMACLREAKPRRQTRRMAGILHTPDELERFIRAHIPLARAMDVRVAGWDGEGLEMTAPLAPNINDKACAFGGSLSGLMTLAGWGLVVLALGKHGVDADVYVARAETRYLAPLFTDLHASARLAEDEGSLDFLATLEARGKARLRVDCRVAGGNGDACVQRSDFAARLRRDG
jgi:thioesterase domain-containing protein